MIDAYFYSLSKRENSTKKPSGQGYQVRVAFKETTDLEKPTLEIRDANVVSYNYCRIPAYSKYYKVVGRRSLALGVWEIDLEEDYLATWISSIMGQNVLCAMSSVDFDEQLDDERIVPVPAANIQGGSCSFDIINALQNNKIILTKCATVINETGEFNGIDVIYGWGADDYLAQLADPTFYSNIKTLLGGGDPFENVCETWVTCLKPSACHAVGTKTIDLNNAHYEVDYLNDLKVTPHFDTIAIPQTSYTDFRYSDRFVKYYLKIPYIGIITIPTELVRASGSNLLEVSYSGDILTGQMVVTASIRGISLGVFGTSLKSPIPLSKQASPGASMVVQGVGGAIGGAVTGAKFGGGWGALGGAIAGGGMGVASAAIRGVQIEKASTSMGSIALSGLYQEFDRIYCYMVEYPSDEAPANFEATSGRPCHKVVTVKNGYMQTQNASFDFAGSETEIAAVNAAFDQGVYVE